MALHRTNDESTLISKAGVLIEALPWLMDYAGKIMVIKYGGNAMIDDELKCAFAQDIVFLRQCGVRPVVVHGGGEEHYPHWITFSGSPTDRDLVGQLSAIDRAAGQQMQGAGNDPGAEAVADQGDRHARPEVIEPVGQVITFGVAVLGFQLGVGAVFSQRAFGGP